MANIEIIFTSNKKNIFHENPSPEKIAKARFLQSKYCIRKIHEIETDQNIIVEIDIDKIKDEINWGQYKKLSPEILEHINEIEIYHEIFMETDSIISMLNTCLYADRIKIKALGERAIKIIENNKESELYKDLDLQITHHLSKLMEIVKFKEVYFLTEQIQAEDSLLSRIDAANNAVRSLTREISAVRMSLSSFQ